MTSNNSTQEPTNNSQTNHTEPDETLEQAFQLLIEHMKQQNKEPLILFPRTKSAMNHMVAQLDGVKNLDEVLIILSDLKRHISQSHIPHEALEAFMIPSWKNLELLIEQAQIESDSYEFDHYPVKLQMKISALAMVWEHLFREIPFEMSRAYLAVGRNVSPLKYEYFDRFVHLVSKKIGRNVDNIVHEQIPSLE